MRRSIVDRLRGQLESRSVAAKRKQTCYVQWWRIIFVIILNTLQLYVFYYFNNSIIHAKPLNRNIKKIKIIQNKIPIIEIINKIIPKMFLLFMIEYMEIANAITKQNKDMVNWFIKSTVRLWLQEKQIIRNNIAVKFNIIVTKSMAFVLLSNPFQDFFKHSFQILFKNSSDRISSFIDLYVSCFLILVNRLVRQPR
jgi:hypothetical protein